MIDIVITVYNRLEITKRCIESVFLNTKEDTYRLIIIDNFSTDGTREWLIENIKDPNILILLNQNLGLERAKNIGLTLVASEYYVDSDNDILVPKLSPQDWLTELHALMVKNPEFAATAMRCQFHVGAGNFFKDAPEIAENNVVGGSMRMMKTDIVRRVGGWRNQYENRSEEWNISGKLKKEGYKIGYARDIFCYHMFGEDHAWGYGANDHGHGDRKCAYVDSMFPHDPITLVPVNRKNE